MMLPDIAPASHCFSPEHEQFRRTVRDWVARETAPNGNSWDEAEVFPRKLRKRAAELGVLGLGGPEELGDSEADSFFTLAALAVTEPSGGSDTAALKTRAVRDDDHCVVNGEKTAIASGMRADFIACAVRTDAQSNGAQGISARLIEADSPGPTRTKFHKLGWWTPDTAPLRLESEVKLMTIGGGSEEIMKDLAARQLGI